MIFLNIKTTTNKRRLSTSPHTVQDPRPTAKADNLYNDTLKKFRKYQVVFKDETNFYIFPIFLSFIHNYLALWLNFMGEKNSFQTVSLSFQKNKSHLKAIVEYPLIENN